MSDLELQIAEQDPDTPLLDVHGEHVQNALYALDTFLYQQQGVSPVVKVLCGIGTGAVKQAVQAELQKHPVVKQFRPALRADEASSVFYIRI